MTRDIAIRLLRELNQLSQQLEIGLQDLEGKLLTGNVSIEHVEQWKVELDDEIPKRKRLLAEYIAGAPEAANLGTDIVNWVRSLSRKYDYLGLDTIRNGEKIKKTIEALFVASFDS